MLTNLYFVRHAHSTYTPDELGRPLSDQGFNDAKAVTQLLKTENIHFVYSSPYKRAIQTVAGVATYIGQEIKLAEDFKERLLSENPIEDFPTAISKVWADEDFSWPGGESNRKAQRRGVRATLRVVEDHPGKNIVIGIHGNIMVLIMNHFDNMYGYEFWKKLKMPDIYKLTFNGIHLIDIKKVGLGQEESK